MDLGPAMTPTGAGVVRRNRETETPSLRWTEGTLNTVVRRHEAISKEVTFGLQRTRNCNRIILVLTEPCAV